MDSASQFWDLEVLTGLFQQAGAIAWRYFDAPPTELKSDRTVVTVADREIEACFARVLDQPDRDRYLIGEETVDNKPVDYIQQALNAPCCWVLDPIDGTAPYSAHMDFWGVSLGLLENGRLTNGAVYLPCFDILLATNGDQVVYRHLKKLGPWQLFTAQPGNLGTDGHILLGQMPAHQWGYSKRNTLFAICSCVASFYLLFCGKAEAYCGTFKLWDIAGILPIAQRLNCQILSTDDVTRQLSGDLAQQMFELSDPAKMWQVKNPVIAAFNKNTALAMLKNFHPIQPLTGTGS
ncbi:MAG: hypothetical protein E7052_02025 [Lentisphaerae bacterium]|nr:hypothetical protein [Lentisphaerota bacterium]